MVKDVTEATFEQEVIERSKEVPVVVDFWAEWCGPCRALGPIIEQAVAERDGKVELAKLDTDSNPGISQAFGIRGIPAVKAFKGGKVVSEFVGVQPPPAVARFLDALLPSPADHALERARELYAKGEREAALEELANATGFAAEGLAARIALEDDPELAGAFEALDAGDTERGLDLLIEALARADEKDSLRQVIVGVLDELGVEHPLAREARRKLASALY
jgi:putative thioredoxin